MILAVILAPSPAMFNMYTVCQKDPDSPLNHCIMLKAGFMPYDSTIYVLFAPIILAYSNVKFKIAIWPLMLAVIQLMATLYKVITDGGRDGCLPSMGSRQLANPPMLFIWPFLLMLVAMWKLENTDRKMYSLRKIIEKRHATQLKITHLESKAAAEETLMSFLCHGAFFYLHVLFLPPPLSRVTALVSHA
jgi:hypothetical protein